MRQCRRWALILALAPGHHPGSERVPEVLEDELALATVVVKRDGAFVDGRVHVVRRLPVLDRDCPPRGILAPDRGQPAIRRDRQVERLTLTSRRRRTGPLPCDEADIGDRRACR